MALTAFFTVVGQFDMNFSLFSQGAGQSQQNETFKVLVGPVLSRREFFRAIGTASMAKTNFFMQSAPPSQFGWSITGIDADWDDESGQVELRVEVSVLVSGLNNRTGIGGLAFQVTILAAVAA